MASIIRPRQLGMEEDAGRNLLRLKLNARAEKRQKEDDEREAQEYVRKILRGQEPTGLWIERRQLPPLPPSIQTESWDTALMQRAAAAGAAAAAAAAAASKTAYKEPPKLIDQAKTSQKMDMKACIMKGKITSNLERGKGFLNITVHLAWADRTHIFQSTKQLPEATEYTRGYVEYKSQRCEDDTVPVITIKVINLDNVSIRVVVNELYNNNEATVEKDEEVNIEEMINNGGYRYRTVKGFRIGIGTVYRKR